VGTRVKTFERVNLRSSKFQLGHFRDGSVFDWVVIRVEPTNQGFYKLLLVINFDSKNYRCYDISFS
jgi:hypothetical protein